MPGVGVYRLKEYIADILVKKNILSGTRDYQKFIILGWYRTGSNFLATSINSHPNVICYSELFFPKKIFWSNGVYGKRSDSEELIKIRNKSSELFIKEHVFRCYPKHIKAVGFKIFYPQFENPVYDNLVKDIKNINGLKIIHIKRRNYLNVLISQKIGAQTGKMLSVTKRDIHRKQQINNMYISPQECHTYFTKLDTLISKYDEVFSSNDMQTIYYEDLVSNYSKDMNDIYRFLDVPICEAHSILKKQNYHHISDIISNYNELRDFFMRSKWESFFN
jgi:hypothetical protein